MSTSTPRGLPLKVQALVTTWSITAFILFGAGWLLGLQATWWQRVLLALPVAGLAYLDSRGHTPIVEIRARLTRLLAELGAIQLPLAVAGGAWLLGLTPGVAERIGVCLVIALVAALYRYAPHAAAPTAGGTP
nr:hypothetical protein [Streptomyces sp. DSM 41633]